MEFTADVAEMRAHRDRLQQLTDSANQTRDLAIQTGIDGLPLYGIFCSPLVVPPLAIASAANAAAIAGVGAVMKARTGAMSLTADAYETTEKAAIEISEALHKVIK